MPSRPARPPSALATTCPPLWSSRTCSRRAWRAAEASTCVARPHHTRRSRTRRVSRAERAEAHGPKRVKRAQRAVSARAAASSSGAARVGQPRRRACARHARSFRLCVKIPMPHRSQQVNLIASPPSQHPILQFIAQCYHSLPRDAGRRTCVGHSTSCKCNSVTSRVTLRTPSRPGVPRLPQMQMRKN